MSRLSGGCSVLALILSLAAWTPAADAASEWMRLEWGQWGFSKNELHVQSWGVEDPAGFRCGAQFGHIVCKVSGNVVGPDGSEIEIGMIVFKKDERFRCDPSRISGQIEFWTLDDTLGTGDNAMRRIWMGRTGQVWNIGDPEPPGNPPCAGGYRR